MQIARSTCIPVLQPRQKIRYREKSPLHAASNGRFHQVPLITKYFYPEETCVIRREHQASMNLHLNAALLI